MDPQQGFHWPRVPAWPLNTVLGSSPLTSYKRMPFATPETEDPPLVDDPCWLSKIRKFLLPYSIWLMVSWCFMCVSILPNQVLHITFSSLAISRSPWRSSFAAEKLQQDECPFFWSPFFDALDAESTSTGIIFLPDMIHENDVSLDHKLLLWKRSVIVLQVKTWNIEVAMGVWYNGDLMMMFSGNIGVYHSPPATRLENYLPLKTDGCWGRPVGSRDAL